ncbi:YciI family protein [Nocardiopsis exhalans]|uniref:YciI family protein n=1 Tax=Nocardiopsis exhalans TaxID=163604 RepID=A0ABY5DC04_9ACTN|nr:YciI family protein [Nocardiopsis exhalans]USY21886.1 YciI family protein [Nocardiopsis exhalans]
MFHVLILRYTADAEAVASHLPDHIGYLDKHHSRGLFLLSGRIPAESAEVILARGERDEIEAVAGQDPLFRQGLCAYEILSADPGLAHPDLSTLLGSPTASSNTVSATPSPWAVQEYRGLRPGAAGLDTVLSGRPVGAVAHRAGTAVLAALRAGQPQAADTARRCVRELRERDWPGDGLLADALDRALVDEAADTELAPVPVDLEDLADAAGSGPVEEGAFDPVTGEVLPAAVLECDALPDGDELDWDRLITVGSDSTDAYQDMADFTETVADADLRGRLRQQLDGRGAFRRFKNTVHGEGGDTLSSWTIFSEERGLGRARQWLADHGYRPDERTALR